MKKTTLKTQFFSFFFIIAGILLMNAQEYVPFSPRLEGDNIQIRGDIIFVGNNIVNRASEANPEEANIPYNGNRNNNSFNMEYVDIDSDTDTFSSSSAELNLNDPDCSQVRYAGLYWAGTYPNERSTNSTAEFEGTPRIEEWNEIKFKIPGGNYVDLVADNNADPAGEEDDIIMDGYQPLNPTEFAKDAPIICYKNITNLVRTNANPIGEYTAANIRATRGRRNGSSSAGWVMVIIYENPNESGKFISTFDGYAGLSRAVGNVDVSVSGFKTLPSPFDVEARIGVAALEGDFGIRNDRFAIEAAVSTGGFTDLEENFSPNNNFFNSTITTDGAQVPTRTPYGTNTLGLDLDLIELNNPSNSVLPNDETNATLRFTSTGDGYGAFLTSFSVVIIEPDIILEKKVREFGNSDPLTNDITGQGVNLADDLIYELSFRNIGNDDVTNYTIRDILPVNTAFVNLDLDGAPGVSFTHDPLTNEITLTIPDDLVIQNGPTYNIRIHVKVAENCFDFVDACTNLIENVAFSTYQGIENSAVITDDPSVSDFDNCGFVTPGATNFLLDDISDCNFTRTAELCSNSLTLTAGTGFDEYIWVRDNNNNNIIDATDTVLLNGGPTDNTFTVNDAGTYIVDKIVAAPCISFKEVIIVERFGTTQTNPIVDFFNDSNADIDPDNDIQGEITRCVIDGREVPNIFLCGANDSQPISLNITDANSISWEQLDEGSCNVADPSCPVTSNSCYNQVSTGNVFNANSAGYYRVVINYAGGCNSTFYFNVFQNDLEIIHPEPRDIICSTPGNITITNLGNAYGYQLFNITNNSIDVPFSANNGPSFDIQPGDGGAYRVDVVQLNSTGDPISGACIFQTENIEILDRNFQVDLRTTPANCNSLGSINVQVLNVNADYAYELWLDDGTPPPTPPSPDPYFGQHPGGTFIDDETAQSSNNFDFNNVFVDPTTDASNYFVITRTEDGCFDVQSITVTRDPEPTISALTTADIGCVAGTILLTPNGGPLNSDYSYAIWSKDGTILHQPGGSPTEQEIVNNIPGSAYTIDPTFVFGFRDDDADGTDEYIPNEDGEYVFLIVDDNNCYALSNPVTINDNGGLTIETPTEIQPSCNGDSDGVITINITGGTAPYEYSIDNGNNYQDTPTFAGLTTGNYTLRVLDSAGCDMTLLYNLAQPDTFSASAGISRDFTCNPTIGAEVRITNVIGGTLPYSFSFDGGATYGSATTMLLPAGTYTIIARDASCEFPITVEVPDLPSEPLLTLSPTIEYNCNGTGNIVIMSDIDIYDYTYEIDDVFNAPDPTSNAFNNLPARSTPYKITTNYVSQTAPTASVLLVEDFGSGSTIPSPNTAGYTYEDQTPNPPGDGNSNINDFEYSVTNNLVAPFGTWINPNNHTDISDTSGRYLVMNVGTPEPGQIIYLKRINDVIPNQPLQVSLWLINLLRTGTNGLDPNLTIEIRETVSGNGNLVQSITTGNIPKNNGANDWTEFVANLDPENNTSLDFVIISEIQGNDGNDFALDDILVEQIPEVCELSIDTFILIEPGNTFAASGTNSTDISCNGLSDGSITFSVENFDPNDGFEYSVDGGINYINSLVSPVTTNPVFGAGDQTVLIRRPDDFSCATSVTRNITEPAAIIATGTITTAITCDVNATITASATGGIAPYHYQLQDAVTDVAIAGYDFATNTTNIVFSDLPAGSYEVAVIDRNGLGACPGISDPINIIQPTAPSIDSVTPTLCYSGNSDGTITVVASGGNGEYQFKINDALGNPWVSPNASTPNTHTFTNLSEGSYTIDVKDSLGCDAIQEIDITINPALSISATAADITACGNSTNVNITASGGDGNLVFAYAITGSTPANTDFSNTNPIEITAAGTYDIFVRDNNNNSGIGGTVGTDFCQEIFSIVINQDDPISVTPSKSDVTCNGDTNGSISIGTVTGGEAPFTYSLDNGITVTDQFTPDFNNLSAGNYTVQITDTNGCQMVAVIPVTINEPDLLSADIPVVTQMLSCPSTLAEITVSNPLGGTNSYQYSINNGTWTAATTGGQVFTGLSDGSYSIQIRDANAITCIVTLPSVTVNPLPTPPIIDDAITYNCDGTGNVTITPFDATYTYTLNTVPDRVQTGADGNIFNNVPVGNYSITVEYGNNCSVVGAVNVIAGNAFDATITAFTNPTCNTGSDGTVTISVENFGAGGFEYRLNDVGGTNPFIGPFFSNEQINGLSGIIYDIEIRDVDNATIVSPLTGCAITLNQTLTEPIALVTSASITEEFTCNNTGAVITASATGGTPTYVYQLEDNLGTAIPGFDFTTNGNNTVFTNLGAGTYIVRARDINTCSDAIDIAITITAPNNPTFTAEGTACYTGANDASIQVDVTSIPGNGGFEFSLNGAPWVTPGTISHTFTNLANGTYTIDVRDVFGCSATQQTVILNPQLRATTTLQPDLTCIADATVTINAVGGSGTYVYEWSTTNTGPWNTSNFTANVYNTDIAGTYFFRITDTTIPTVCTFITEEVIITPADTPVITSITPTNLNCNNDSSGALNIVIDTSIGLAPYIINVVNTTTGTVYGTQTSGLSAGVYDVTVTDAKGCFVTNTETIVEPNIINYTPTTVPIQCNDTGANPSDNTTPGEISITGITGGTPEYTYNLTANNGIAPQTYTTTPGARDHTFTILSFGIYQIDVVDANGCSAFSTEIIASPPDDLDIDVSTSTANCTDGGTAIVTVDAAVGSGNYEFALLETFNPPYSSNYVAPDTPGGTTATFSSTANGIRLNPGVTYTFVVFDLTTRCYYFETSELPIDTPSNMTASLDAVNNVTCTGSADGNISFTFDNYDVGATNVNYEIFNLQSNLTTGITGSSTVNPPTGAITVNNFATLAPGEYYMLLSEVGGPFNGCSINGGNFTIRESVNLLNVTPVVTQNDNCATNAGIITATGEFGTAPYEYQILPSGSTALTIATWAGTSNNVFNVEGGDYDVYIRDANNCIQTNPINLPTDNSPEISLTVVDECATEGNYEVLVTLDQAGISPYRLSVNNAAFQNITFNGSNQYTITGLSSGVAQTIEISDLNGCGEIENITIFPNYSASAMLTKLLDCTASPNAEITITATGGSGSFEYEITGPVNQTRIALPTPANSTIWDLANVPGTYTISVYDVNTPSCPATTFPVEIAPRLEPIFDIITPTDVTCNTANDGTITTSVVNNGIGAYTFQITSLDGATITINPTSNTATSATFTGLAPTTTPAGYIITARANSVTNDCPTNSTSVIINEPNPIVITLDTVVEFICVTDTGNNENNASISVQNVVGGSNNFVNYQFFNDLDLVNPVQEGTNDTYIETNFTGGNYTIIVFDDNGCSDTVTASIAPFDELLTVDATHTITCNPIADGEITIAVTSTENDVSQFEYSIDNGATWQNTSNTPVNTNVFSGLTIGTHNFLVRHTETGCILPVSETIIDPNTFDITITDTTNVTCIGDANGTVTFTITDATYLGSYSWSIFNDNNTPLDFSDDGSAIDSGDETTLTSTILPAGGYYISVVQDGVPTCDNREVFNISEPSEILTADRRVTEVTCDPTDNGIIEIFNAQGGRGDYRYLVFDTTTAPAPDTNDRGIYVTDPKFENLVVATYQVWVIDAEGCPLRLTDVTLDNPTPITAALQINQQNCTNFDGIIEVVGIPATDPVSGGQGSNYTFQLIKDAVPFGAPQTTTTFSNLGAGVYTLTVTDQWGCMTTTTAVTLFDQIVPQATIAKAIDCNSGGTINVTQTGGSGTSYTYEITAIDGTPTSIAPTSNTTTTASFVGLTTVGVYTFTITDDAIPSACSKTIERELVDIVEPIITLDNATNVTCNGLDNGTIAVSITNNGLTPYTFEIISIDGVVTPILPTSNTATTATFTGLMPTNGVGVGYTIRVLGGNGCDDTIDVTITEPAIIDLTIATPIEFLCATDAGNNENNASISVQNVAGGSNNFVNYQFFNDLDLSTPVQEGTSDTYIETNFAGGNYTIIVFDDNGCSATATASIAPFDELLSAPITQTSILCSGEDISIDAISSITNYSVNPGNYEFREVATPTNTFQGSNVFLSLSVGLHNFEVRNIATGCSIIVQHIVQNPNTFDLSVNELNDVICNGTISGAITLDITDNIYTGSFDWEVFETNGTLDDETDDTSVISGSAVANSTTATINLGAGSYRVSINQTVDPGCDLNRFFTITEPETIVPNASIESGVTCSNGQGSILVNPDGGEGPFTITLTNTTTGQPPIVQVGVSAYLFENLSGGIFDIQIEDTIGCVQNFPGIIELEIPEPIVAIATQGTLNCFNENTASITANINPRTIPATPIYSYQLNIYDETGTIIIQTSTSQSDDTFSNLNAGIYSITVTDDAGCSAITNTETIINPDEVFALLTRTSPLTCATGVELLLTANGGTGPYEYFNPITNTWIAMSGSGGTSEVFPNANFTGPLGDGSYQFMVRDAFDCESILSNAIIEDPIEDLILIIDPVTSTSVSCNGENSAVIFVDAEGGLGDYMYELFTDSSLSTTSRIAGPQSQGEFIGLIAGDYYVTVTSGDCPVVSEHIFIDEPTLLEIIDPNDFTNATCFGANDGTITVELQGGSGGYIYAISPNLNQFDTVNTFDELSPGDYTIIAQDQNGCFLELQYTIDEPTTLNASATSVPEICVGNEDGIINLDIQGGTAPYSTRLSDEDDFIQDRLSILNLAAGGYIVFIRDANGCETNVSITVDSGANINAIIEPVYECTGDTLNNFVNITLEDSSVIGDVLYGLDVTDRDNPDVNELQLNPDFRNSAPGTHYITIAHSNGCVRSFEFEIRDIAPLTLTLEQNNLNEITAVAEGGEENYTFYFEDINNGEDNTLFVNRTDTYVVRVVDENGCESIANIFIEFIDIEIPNFFTPDGDGLNDFFIPRNMEAFPEILTIIFDRYGREVYRFGVDNPGWNGLYNETELPTGDYWYIIKLNGESDDREFVGHFTLYR